MLVNAKSEIGLVRQANEDSYACIEPVYIVADGMGGHVAGEIASKLAVETIKNFIRECEKKEDDIENLLRDAVLAANTSVLNKAKVHKEYSGMGTTISMIYLQGDRCFWAHVGDSRIYLGRDGTLCQITQDHSLVWNLVSEGTITKAEALTHPQRNMLTRAVGVNLSIEIDTGSFTIARQDRLLLCTDGLTNMVRDPVLQEILLAENNANKADLLVDAALIGGGIDNITAIVIEQ